MTPNTALGRAEQRLLMSAQGCLPPHNFTVSSNESKAFGEPAHVGDLKV